jgi:hemolysin III
MELPDIITKPRFRGVLHQWAFAVAAGAGVTLLLTAEGGRARVAAAIYSASVLALFGTSALYHRRTWSPARQRLMARLDHSMIFVLIAGTYTPFCLLVLEGGLGWALLAIAWGGALVGTVMQLSWPSAPRWVVALSYVLLGWVAVGFMPAMWSRGGIAVVVLLAVGGLFYSVGAVVYATQRPDPHPSVFGYHEVFHALTVVAAAVHFVAVAGFALPSAA